MMRAHLFDFVHQGVHLQFDQAINESIFGFDEDLHRCSGHRAFGSHFDFALAFVARRTPSGCGGPEPSLRTAGDGMDRAPFALHLCVL